MVHARVRDLLELCWVVELEFTQLLQSVADVVMVLEGEGGEWDRVKTCNS